MVVLDIIMRTPCGMWISNGKVFAAGVVMNRAEDTEWKMPAWRSWTGKILVECFCFLSFFLSFFLFSLWLLAAHAVSQAEALWESKSQIAGLACQNTRYKGPVYQTARQNNNNNQSAHNFRDREVTVSCDN